MTPLDRKYPLARASVALQASNPHAWAEFLKALVARYDDTTDNFVSATPDSMPQMQGRARELRELLSELDGARATVEQKDKQTNGSRP